MDLGRRRPLESVLVLRLSECPWPCLDLQSTHPRCPDTLYFGDEGQLGYFGGWVGTSPSSWDWYLSLSLCKLLAGDAASVSYAWVQRGRAGGTSDINSYRTLGESWPRAPWDLALKILVAARQKSPTTVGMP